HSPTIFMKMYGATTQVPVEAFGTKVKNLPAEVGEVYDEARRCMSVYAYTSAVLSCRKLLMNVAVAQGASPSQSFVHYVDYLNSNGYIPPNGRDWVDYVRSKGNEATHEIHTMSRGDAEHLITFMEMLLRFVYDFPKRIPVSSKH
uniref:DUF4145 domain-containing protein n=1 Tax=Aquisphaera insulae TaxID=2712864 RepID=UPI00196B2D05